jgi:hypothetical protein
VDNGIVQSKKKGDEYGIQNLEDADNEHHINFVGVNDNLQGKDMSNFADDDKERYFV